MHPHFAIAYFGRVNDEQQMQQVKEQLGELFDCVIDHSKWSRVVEERARCELEFVAGLIEWGLGALPQGEDPF